MLKAADKTLINSSLDFPLWGMAETFTVRVSFSYDITSDLRDLGLTATDIFVSTACGLAVKELEL